jgi:hypothetical protein
MKFKVGLRQRLRAWIAGTKHLVYILDLTADRNFGEARVQIDAGFPRLP